MSGLLPLRSQEADSTNSHLAGVYSSTSIISPADANVLAGLSPLNWVRRSTFLGTGGTGTSLTVAFTGTRHVSLLVDTAVIKVSAAPRYPILAWTVNDGLRHLHQLSAGETSFPLSSDVENPVIDLYVRGMSPFEDRYSGEVPVNSVKITGFAVDSGGKTKAIPFPPKLWLNVGDSIMAGDEAAYSINQGRPSNDAWAASDDSRASYGYLLATHYGYRESRIATGGYDWGGGLASIPPLATLIDHITSTVSRLDAGKLDPAPNVVLINLGENGAPASSDVTNSLAKIRNRVQASTQIFVMIPISGRARKEVADAFNAYCNSSHDPRAYLIDLGTLSYATGDGQHPTAAGHRSIYEAAVPQLDQILRPVSASP